MKLASAWWWKAALSLTVAVVVGLSPRALAQEEPPPEAPPAEEAPADEVPADEAPPPDAPPADDSAVEESSAPESQPPQEEPAVPPEEPVAEEPAPQEEPVAPLAEPEAAPQDDSAQAAEAAAERLARERERVAVLAREFMANGDRLMERELFQEALEAYASALELDPNLEEARTKFDEVAARLGLRTTGIGDVAREARETLEVRHAQARIALDEAVRAGEEKYAVGDFRSARQRFEDARFILKLNPYLRHPMHTVSSLSARIEDAASREKDQESVEAERLRVQVEEAESARATSLEAKAQAERDALRTLAREAFDLGDYAAAEEYCLQILRSSPNDAEARGLLEIARRESSREMLEDSKAQFGEEWQRAFERLPFDALPQTSMLEMDPLVWENAVRRGPLEFTPAEALETPEEREIAQRLEETHLQVDFENTDIETIADVFATRTGVNFVITPQLREALTESERTVSLKVEDTSVRRALDLIGEIRPIRATVEDGVVKLVTPEQVRKRLHLQFYEIRDLTRPIVNFPSREINLRPSVGFVEEAKPEEAEPVPVVLEAERLIELIRATIDPQSWNENPDATINVQHGTLVVKQSREVHDQIRSLLSDLRASAGLLVSIEARFLMVADNFLEDVGIDFRGLGDDTGGVGVGGGGTNNPMDDLGNVGTPATPSGPGTGNDSGGFYLDNDNLDVRGRSENLFDQILGGGNLSNTGGLSLQYTFLDDTELEVILRAVEKDERIQTLNAPRLMVHDTQRAHLTVLNQVSYVRDFEVEVSQAATIADPVIDVIQDGVILDVLPIVSADRRFVTMELRPTVAQLDRPITQFSTSLGNGNPVILQLPTLRVQRVRTTVTVPDGGVLLLGGARFFTQQDLESGIPFLNKVPVASFLFNRKGRFEGRQQLLILLKSHIVVPDEEATLAASRVM